MTVPKEIIS